MSKLNITATLLAGASLVVFAVPAFAQTASDVESASSVDEIIVTAQRKDESLSKTPVAVAVVSADTLAKAQIVSEQDLRSATPGLSVRTGISSNQLNYSLRGQSQDTYSNTRPGVLPYINEVQVGGPGGSSAFYDLQSVQVLKGPQGTLFGRSATGGAVLFTTAKPSDEFGGYVSALGGNYDALKVEGALTGALVEGVANARVAGFYQERGGFQTNLFDNSRVGDVERYGFRGSLSLTPAEGISNDLVVDYLHSSGQNTMGILSGLLPLAAPGTPPYIPIELLYGGTGAGLAAGQAVFGAFVGGQTAATDAAYLAYFAPGSGHPATGIRQLLTDQQARDPYTVNYDASNFFRSKNVIVTNTTSIDVGENAKIKNIFGYTNFKQLLGVDADGTPYGISQNGLAGSPDAQKRDVKGVSNELQLLGTAFDDKLSYVVGLYFADEKTTHREKGQFFDILFGGQSQQIDYAIKSTTYAGYGQGTYQLNDSGLAATVGVRYTSEKVQKNTLATDSTAPLCVSTPLVFSCEKSETFNRVSWQLGLQNQVNSNVLVYAVTRRAYKSGGFNGSVAPRNGGANVAGDAYLTEAITDAELGVKFNGYMGGAPVRLNIAGYHNWIKNSQRAAFGLVSNQPASLTVNVPKGRTYGAEIDFQIKPVDGLSLGGSFNYTKAKFLPDGVFVNGGSQIFDQVPDTPKTSGTLYADVTIPISDNLSGLLHSDVYAQSKTFNSPRSANNFGTVVGGYAILNFRAGVENKEAGWSITGNVKNASNRVYYSGGIPTGEIYQINLLTPSEPRTVTVEARFKF